MKLDTRTGTDWFKILDVRSTCRRCGEAMIVINPFEHVHPMCEPKMTKLDSLARGYVTAVIHGDKTTGLATRAEIERIEALPPRLPRAAIKYAAEYGWPVFPLRPVGTLCSDRSHKRCRTLCQCPKEPAIRNGHGCLDATTDLDLIRSWWSPAGTSKAQRNIGLATGHLFDVIDIDPKAGGTQSFLTLLAEKCECRNLKAHKRRHCKGFCAPRIHGVVTTASGGIHLYVKATGRGNLANVRGLDGIDYRGKGGYVVAPPSWLGTRRRSYSWLTTPSPTIKGDNNNDDVV